MLLPYVTKLKTTERHTTKIKVNSGYPEINTDKKAYETQVEYLRQCIKLLKHRKIKVV